MPPLSTPRRLVTHAKPDGDALGALWLVQTFLFAGQTVEIVFVSRSASIRVLHTADCVVDVGSQHDPARLHFDHKPPAFSNRNETCATRLVWDHLVSQNQPVAHLTGWVNLVHEGDANPPRKVSDALRQSRQTGYHAVVSQARRTETRDATVYAVVRAYLDTRFARSV